MADGIEAQAKLMRELATQYSITCNADLKIGGLGRGLFAQQVSDHDHGIFFQFPHRTRRCSLFESHLAGLQQGRRGLVRSSRRVHNPPA